MTYDAKLRAVAGPMFQVEPIAAVAGVDDTERVALGKVLVIQSSTASAPDEGAELAGVDRFVGDDVMVVVVVRRSRTSPWDRRNLLVASPKRRGSRRKGPSSRHRRARLPTRTKVYDPGLTRPPVERIDCIVI